jgi:hypothetical protein
LQRQVLAGWRLGKKEVIATSTALGFVMVEVRVLTPFTVIVIWSKLLVMDGGCNRDRASQRRARNCLAQCTRSEESRHGGAGRWLSLYLLCFT